MTTNIAESSLTIPGVRLVLDCGRAKVKETAGAGLEQLRVRWVSQAQAWQRAGRANRQAPGTCYRLYTQAQYAAMPAQPVAEVLRCELAAAALQVLAMGHDPRHLELMESPGAERLQAAVSLLRVLGAAEPAEPVRLTPLSRWSRGWRERWWKRRGWAVPLTASRWPRCCARTTSCRWRR